MEMVRAAPHMDGVVELVSTNQRMEHTYMEYVLPISLPLKKKTAIQCGLK